MRQRQDSPKMGPVFAQLQILSKQGKEWPLLVVLHKCNQMAMTPAENSKVKAKALLAEVWGLRVPSVWQRPAWHGGQAARQVVHFHIL
jgi:hypothetical protein